ncbi:serine/threonine-protein kinase [Amycolatopsis vastitatis]|uniref:non-specific serine/threonine protein kinase n=1 Tax=Amycolatopsis vastitatis TaxID=1905142 RepID=A0A229STT2_9PSEU|nr:serine/threonine-protein kinase [Amycolatopsis vastitatis]OXM62515.1 serine/threonine protein kinase [Amycolatopsis vastitatis]
MIAGHYRLVEHIGSGAMGVVWRATDVRLERTVAIKQILPQPGVSEPERDNMRQRAMREAKNAARFQHPNAIVVFDIAEHNGDPCLVMEYLNGPSLSTILAEEGTLPLGRVARIGEQVASALVAAHRAGIVHRDVKPGNILIDETGTAKITDFGISRAAGDMTLTATGLIGGTPAYLAPELARGADPVPSSDVFALGATLYQAIEGTTPYGNTTNQLALLYAAANGQINPPVQAGAATALLMSLLRSEPAERPSMAEARERLAALAKTEPGGMTASPPLLAGGAGRKPAAPADGGERPPWQRTENQAPSSPPVGTPVPAAKTPSNPPRPTAAFMPMRSPAAPPNTPPRPMPAASPTARAPQYSSNTPKADNKRKYALFAGGGAAVVVVAVIVFLVLNSGGGGGAANNQAGQSPGSQPTAGQSTSKTNSSSSAANAAGKLGQTPSEGRITDYGAAGRALTAFYDNPAGGWSKLTPAAQQVYGSEQAFTDYWANNKAPNYTTARADSGGGNSDGSITMNLTVNGQRNGYRIVTVGGQMLIDADTRLGPQSSTSGQ